MISRVHLDFLKGHHLEKDGRKRMDEKKEKNHSVQGVHQPPGWGG